MKSLNCEDFNLTIRFDEQDFDKRVFIEEVVIDGEGATEEGKGQINYFVSHYNSKGKIKKEHAHIELSLNGENSSLEMTIHPGKIETGLDVAEIPLEDALKYTSNYFSDLPVKCGIGATFKFGRNYKSLLKLRYPLLAGQGLLQEGVVTGYTIEFPAHSLVKRVLISDLETGTLVIINAGMENQMSKIKPYTVMKEVARLAQSFVTKAGNNNAEED